VRGAMHRFLARSMSSESPAIARPLPTASAAWVRQKGTWNRTLSHFGNIRDNDTDPIYLSNELNVFSTAINAFRLTPLQDSPVEKMWTMLGPDVGDRPFAPRGRGLAGDETERIT